MIIFYDSSRTLNDQSVTLLRSMNEPPEKGVVLKVHPLGSSVPSSSSTTIPRPPSLSQWWVESSHELHDPTRKDSHVISRTFTLASNLHSTADHVHPFPLLSRRISAREVQWALPSSKTLPVQYRGSRSKAVPRMFRYSGDGAAKHYDEVTAQATDESSGGACLDKAHSPKRGPSCIVSTPQDMEVTEGKCASDSERNSGNSDSHWRRKRQRDNPSKNLDNERVTQATNRGVDMDSLLDPSGGSAQVSLNSLFDDFDLEPIKDLCFLHDDLEAISSIQELFENDNLGILPMQDDNYPSKRAGEKCTPVATSPSTSEFSIQGPTAFNLATKEIDPSHSGKTNATLSSEPIHKPSRDVTRNKSIMCSSSIPATSTVTKFEPDDLISKADRQRAKMLGGELIEKVVKTPFTLVTSFRDGVEKILQVIAQIKVVDATPLRECISKYMDDVDRYSSLYHALSQGIAPEDKEWMLTDARHRLTLALNLEAIKIDQKVAIKVNLDKALAREIELKKELESLSMQKVEFTASSTLCDAELAQQQVIISQIKGEVSKIEATPTLEAFDNAKLRELQELLETSKEELRHLDWIG
nr:hypothetical protein CFP56_32951 [Quercus suber]